MQKLPYIMQSYPRITESATTKKQTAQAMSHVRKIIPSILKKIPAEVLLPIESLLEKAREFQNSFGPILINGQELHENFFPIKVISGITEKSFLHDFMNPDIELLISVSFKMEPIKADYGESVDHLERKKVYNTLKFELRHYHHSPQNGFRFILEAAKYPKKWMVCERCFESFDFTTLDHTYFYCPLFGYNLREGTKEFARNLYVEHLLQGNDMITITCPHCQRGIGYHENNFIPTIEEYEKFYP